MPDENKPETYEELDAAITAAVGGTPDAAPPAEPQMLEVKLATGQVYKGKTEKEVIDQLVKAQEHASMTIHEKDQQLKQVLSQMSTQRSAPATENAGFDQAKYFKLMEQNALEAADYLDSFRPKVREAYQSVQQLKQGGELTAFLNTCQDFPSTDPSAISAMKARMNAEGREPTADNLELVYGRLTREGVIKPAPKQSSSEQIPAPAPVLGGHSASSAPDPFAELERMSMAELEKVYRRKGLIQ